MRWAKGPPHLALNPPYLFFWFCFFLVSLFIVFLSFFGGFKGQVRWPEGPPHLALNPPYLFLLFFLLSFGFLYKKPCFPPRKGPFLLIFSVSLSFSLSLFWPPSFSVSLSLSLSFLRFFLYSFLSLFFAFFWFLVLVSVCIFLSSLRFFHERNNIKIFNCKFFLHQYFLFFGFQSFFCFKFLFSYLCYFLISSYVFCSTSRFFGFNTNNLKTEFLVNKGVATKRCFLSTCVLQNVKSYRFVFGHFFGNFWLMFKKHYKNRYFSTFQKPQFEKKWQFVIVTNWATLIVTNWATFVQLKNRQRGPVSNY